MQPLDGNAIAGMLSEHFGVEMTEARGSCAHCDAAAQVGELRVYLRAPGAVVRCASCGQVVMVLAEVHGALRLHSGGFRLRNLASDGSSSGPEAPPAG